MASKSAGPSSSWQSGCTGKVCHLNMTPLWQLLWLDGSMWLAQPQQQQQQLRATVTQTQLQSAHRNMAASQVAAVMATAAARARMPRVTATSGVEQHVRA